MKVLAPTSAPALPSPRGPISQLLIERLARAPHELPAVPAAPGGDPLADDD
ncbi:MAG: hypothetical protein QOK25_1492, partial [Thermoleophilaceae bacterium]|nr:hypothetical protein [Thermoleophilaceae bacterium]